MNIEEARTVLWLKNNHRPLGELLDEGYLTKDRLEWAAKKAYDPTLKQAAQVVLESLNHPSSITQLEEKPKVPDIHMKEDDIHVGISVDKARSTPWPFGVNKGQLMGALVDAKQLSLKDLAYAIESAWDQRVKQAAIVLSLVKLNQVVKEPIPSAGFVHVISGGRSYAERQATFFTLIQGMFIGIVGTMAFAILFQSVHPRNPDSPTLAEFLSKPGGFLSLLIVIAIFVFIGWLINFLIDRVSKKLDDQIEAYRLGQEGEDTVVQQIIPALDGNWHLFRNVVIPGRNKADLDIVLVGPPGIWVLEIKNFNGKYRLDGDTWQYEYKRMWRNTSKNPSRQATDNSLRLKNFLKADHLNVYVNPVVVWASVTSPLFIQNPTVPVWYYRRLPDEIGNIWQGEKLSEAERSRIVEKLTTLCEQQKNRAK